MPTHTHTVTNIRLEREALRELKRRAVEQDRSLASLLREIIDDYLGRDTGEEAGRKRSEVQRRSVKAWAGSSLGTGFSGRDHDEVLYRGEE